MRVLSSNPNVDNSDLVNYPNGRIKDNDGLGNGTGINERTNGDIHQAILKLMRLYSINANNQPDNESNGFQIIEAMIALASKNDYVLPLTTTGGILQIPLKLGFVKDGESFVCKASSDKGSETQIKGLESLVYTVLFVGTFKANEYVRVVKTSSNITIIRLADSVSLDAMVNDFLYLKKASQSEENAGSIDTVATTPKVNKIAFIKRVNGDDSANYLASTTQNGLLSKEFWDIINTIGESPVKNVGSFSGLDVGGGSVGLLSVDGDIASANMTNTGGGYSIIRCHLANAMDSSDYEVQISLESQGVITADNCLATPVYKIVNDSSFDVSIRETSPTGQNIKVRIRTINV